MNNLRAGGAEKVLITILKYIDPNKYEIDLLVNKKGEVFDSSVPEWVNFKYLFKISSDLPKNPLVSIPYKLAREIGLMVFNLFPQLLYWLGILGKYDIEIAFLETMTPFIAKSPNKKSKKIAWIHMNMQSLEMLRPVYKKNIGNSLKAFDKIVTVSNEVGEAIIHLSTTLKINESSVLPKLTTIYNPIDVDDIIEKSNLIQISKPANEFWIIGLGTLTPAKRFDRLIKAHHKLVSNGISAKLIIVGEGHIRKSLEDLIAELGIQDSVELIGYKPNPYPYLKNADLFVLSSDYEGYPLVLAEALVLEKPVLSTRISGSKEILNDGEFGMLVSPNVDSLFEGMKEIITKKESYHRHTLMAQRGKIQFDCQKRINEIESLLDSL